MRTHRMHADLMSRTVQSNRSHAIFLTATTSPLALHSLCAADSLTRSKAYAQVGHLVRDLSGRTHGCALLQYFDR